eukprot:scaffold107325_cov55-Prasinocladus_malaysianus.AAC.1
MSPEHPLSVAFSPLVVGNLDFLNRLNPPSDVISATATLPTSLEEVLDYGQYIVDHGVPGASIPPAFPQDYEPVRQAALNGLQEASFSVDEPWDQLAGLAMAQNVWDISQEYAMVLLDEIYSKDPMVASDPQLQAWLAAMADPEQGNLPIKQLPKTREALLPFLTYMVYGPLTHSWTNKAYQKLIPASLDMSQNLYFSDLPEDQAVNQALASQREQIFDILVAVLNLYPTDYCAAELLSYAKGEQIMASILNGADNPYLTSLDAKALPEILASEERTRQTCMALKSQRLSADISL